MPAFDTTRLTAQQQTDLMFQMITRDVFGVLTSDYTLTSQTANQKIFNFGAASGGALTLPTGIFEFEAAISIDTMSATSGNGVFDLLGAGTATLAAILQQSVGNDATTQATQAAASAALSAVKTIQLALAATGTAVGALITGTFNISVAGTIIPSIALDTAAAAVVKTGSLIRVRRLGDYGTPYFGAWN